MPKLSPEDLDRIEHEAAAEARQDFKNNLTTGDVQTFLREYICEDEMQLTLLQEALKHNMYSALGLVIADAFTRYNQQHAVNVGQVCRADAVEQQETLK